MAMKMLEAGGVPILTDGVRSADISNPKGYYEFEPVKNLDKKGGDLSWLPEARGKAVKIISFLLTYLPEDYDYKVVFMQRDLEEAITSQNTMLVQRGEAAANRDDEQLREMYEGHLKQVERFLSRRTCFSTVTLRYHEVVDRPRDAAHKIRDLLAMPLDVDRMAAVADQGLYRNRRRVEA